MYTTRNFVLVWIFEFVQKNEFGEKNITKFNKKNQNDGSNVCLNFSTAHMK